MQLLPASWMELSSMSDPELLESKPHVSQALQQAQNVEFSMGAGGVHGNMRLQCGSASGRPTLARQILRL